MRNIKDGKNVAGAIDCRISEIKELLKMGRVSEHPNIQWLRTTVIILTHLAEVGRACLQVTD